MFYSLYLALALLTTPQFYQGSLASGSNGCGQPIPEKLRPGGPSASFHINSSGGYRNFSLYLPETYQNTVPTNVYFSFHGGGKNATEQEGLSQFSNPMFNRDGIAVYPNSIDGHWEGFPKFPTDVSDVQFTNDILDHLLDRYCIDPSRVYAAGKSDGGGLVNILACDNDSANRIAAFAPVSGAFYEKFIGPCSIDRSNVPMLEFHGQNDTTIPYEGGVRIGTHLFPIPTWLQDWAVRDGCAHDAANTTTLLFNGAVEKHTFDCKGQRGIVSHYFTHNLRHTWPSTVPNDDSKIPTVFNATPIILDYFRGHPLPVSL